MNVEVTTLPDLRVATLEHKGPYDEISEAFQRLGQVAGQAGLFGDASAMIAIYHDDPRATPAADLRSEAGIIITPDATIPPSLAELRIPAGKYARTIYVGPYDKLPEIWPQFMGEWLPQNGHRVKDGLSFEIYRNTPGTVPKEALVTELYIAVQ